MYLDDGLGVHHDLEMCHKISTEIKDDLIKSGFVPKGGEKSMWNPSQQVTFLGYYIDCEQGTIQIPEKRLVKLKSTISSLEKCVKVHVRMAASFVGQVISMSYVLGNIVYIMTKSISIDILSAKSWNSFIFLSKESLHQINFWKDNIDKINSRPFLSDYSVHSIVYTDASNTGYGRYIVDAPLSTAHGMWTDSESTRSSTWRELAAVFRVLQSLSHFLRAKHIKWYSDNKNVVSIVSKGSMKSELLNISLDIFEFCLSFGITLDMEWVPRDQNERADMLSRIVDFDDWSVSDVIFDFLNYMWGPHEVDFFANDRNNKLSTFYSRFWTPNAIGIDAFTADWYGVNGWFVPPPSIVTRVLKYMKQCYAYGTLIVPFWKSASFWPFLYPNGQGFIKEIVGVIELPIRKEFYIPGKCTGIFGKSDLPFRMLALRLDCRLSV
ncbi:hypothetical protein FSP39_013568 [Pinctada imbricata]|uniref:Reverse transcriptase RNase H-like domain-containing protein n=1 Tax=Pinctada imbricata TaxID=66713 RepID=A0AA88Y535_PINIB|nr:hypothetical protein FSP39_013568 [Pinctada imbricata]